MLHIYVLFSLSYFFKNLNFRICNVKMHREFGRGYISPTILQPKKTIEYQYLTKKYEAIKKH